MRRPTPAHTTHYIPCDGGEGIWIFEIMFEVTVHIIRRTGDMYNRIEMITNIQDDKMSNAAE